MQLAHWLILAGALLVLGGLLGFALTRNKQIVDPISSPDESTLAK
jgi:hypothetical protein